MSLNRRLNLYRRLNLNLKGMVLGVLLSTPALAANLQASWPISWEGKTIGFATNDPQVEYMRPENWELLRDKTMVQESGSEVLLYTVFKPSYQVAVPYITQQKSQGSSKIFLPLPSVLESAELYLNDLLGQVLIEQLPNP